MTVEQKIADMQQASVEQTQASQALADEVAGKMGEIDKKLNDTTSSLESDYQEKASNLTITASLGYKNAVEKASGGRNTLIIDDQGNENIMVVIPRFNVEDLGLNTLNLGTGTHPAFKTNGADRGEILIGKYLASNGNGGCTVIGGAVPKMSTSYDVAKELCAQKGEGWHMMSVHEWAAIALWSLANNTVPRGNTSYGRSHEKPWETALRYDGSIPGDVSGTASTNVGSGPDTWTHDHGAFGVQDLVGNVWEWLDQLKLEDGQIVSTLDNNPSIVEESWYKHAAFFDSPTDAQSGNAGAPILNSSVENRTGPLGADSGTYGYVHSSIFSSIAKDTSYVENENLRRLLLEFANTDFKGAIYARNYGNRFPARGGAWNNNSYAGLGALYLNVDRSYIDSHFGFRPAFFV